MSKNGHGAHKRPVHVNPYHVTPASLAAADARHAAATGQAHRNPFAILAPALAHAWHLALDPDKPPDK